MAAAITELQARSEHGADMVEVQHVLISFSGAGTSQKRRTREAAEKLAEKVWREAIDVVDQERSTCGRLPALRQVVLGGHRSQGSRPAPARLVNRQRQERFPDAARAFDQRW